MQIESHCPICSSPFCEIDNGHGDKALFMCATCGTFGVSRSALVSLSHLTDDFGPAKRAAISHHLRVATDRGQVPLLTTYDLDEMKANLRLPSPKQQALNLIRFVGDKVAQDGKPLSEFPDDIHAVVGSPNRDFAMALVRQLRDRGQINAVSCGHMESADEVMEISLTLSGWDQYEAEQQGQISGNYGFMALKFGDPVLDPFLRDVIKPAIAKLGMTLEDMRDAAQAGIIDNVMRARIRDSAFVLVDLTHANEGAYWEAGYAEGLGKPVLYLCSKQVFEDRGTHFDTNHCTTVLWDTKNPSKFSDELMATLRRSLGLFQS